MQLLPEKRHPTKHELFPVALAQSPTGSFFCEATQTLVIVTELNGTLVTMVSALLDVSCWQRAMSSGHHSDLRNSFRFPLHLQVTLKTPTGEYRAKTIDISAGGILFHTEACIQVHSEVEFAIEMPKDVLGTDHPVLVKCQGRVVRCSEEAEGQIVAVIIDEYQFERV